MTSGGSSETELRALTVIPNGRSPSSAVTTVTPVTKWPMTRRNVSEPMAVSCVRAPMRGSLGQCRPGPAHDRGDPGTYNRGHDRHGPDRRPASSAIRWARWRSRPTRCTAPRPSGRSSTSRSPASRMPRRFLRALALIKLAAAETNARARPARRPTSPTRSRRPRAEVAEGDHDDQFPIDIYQTGSGTSTNTNMNEVVAHLAAPGWATAERSTRTTTSTAARARTTRSRRRSSCRPRSRSRRSCCPPSSGSRPRWSPRREEFWPVVKTGRTHLQDATPIRLGQEFRGYAGQVEESIRRARAAQAELLDGAARRDRGRDRHQRPPGVRGPGLRPAVGVDRADRPRDRQPLPRPGDARRRDRGARRDPDDRAEPLEDRLGHPADGDGPARRASPSSPCPRPSPGRASCPAR